MSAYSTLVLSDNPEVYYRCDEPSGANLSLLDISGHNRNAPYGGAGNNITAASCLQRDSNAATGTAGASSTSDGDWANGLTAITAECWVRPTTSGLTAGLLTHSYAGAFGNSDAGTFALFLNGGKVHWRVLNTTFNPMFSIEAPTALTLNANHHVVGTWDGVTARIYVNGVQVVSQAASGTMATSSTGIGVGCFAMYSRLGLNGGAIIDEVAGYSRALSTAEVVEHYDAAVTIPGATRYLLPGNGAEMTSGVPPASPFWTSTASRNVRFATTSAAGTWGDIVPSRPTTAVTLAAGYAYVLPVLTEARIIQGEFLAQLAMSSSNNSATPDRLAASLRVVTSTGTTRGTLWEGVSPTPIGLSTRKGYRIGGELTPVSAQVGDRLVFETGARLAHPIDNWRSVTQFGNANSASTDLPSSDGTYAVATTERTWLDLLLTNPPTAPKLYLGNTRVDKIYLGNTQVDKLYLGNTQIT